MINVLCRGMMKNNEVIRPSLGLPSVLSTWNQLVSSDWLVAMINWVSKFCTFLASARLAGWLKITRPFFGWQVMLMNCSHLKAHAWLHTSFDYMPHKRSSKGVYARLCSQLFPLCAINARTVLCRDLCQIMSVAWAHVMSNRRSVSLVQL